MNLSLFAVIAWLIIIAFFLIPKSLTIEENIIMFFLTNIAIISINTILTLNLKLVKACPNLQSFIATIIHRTIIIPLCYLILINLFFSYEKKAKRITASIVTILILTFIEFLSLWTNIKSYAGWNSLLNVSTLTVLMLLYLILGKFIKKVS